MFFSTIEALLIISLSYMLYRFHFTEFFLKKTVVCILLSVISYTLRFQIGETLAPYIVPLIYIFVFAFFLIFISKIPTIWSVIISLSGYSYFIAFQTLIVIVLQSLGIINLNEAQNNTFDTYLVQLTTVLIAFPTAFSLQRKGIGFTFDLEKYRWKIEKILVVFFLIISLFTISFIFYINNLFIGLVVFFLLLSLLIYYGFKKEVGEN